MIYRSNLRCPDLEPAFAHAVSEPYGCGHDVMHDRDFQPGCGFMSHDEAAILYRIAKAVGGDWIEIGTHTGWSAAHVALGASSVAGIDPELRKPDFWSRADENLTAAGVRERIQLWPMTSAEYFAGYVNGHVDGAVIDGDHTAPNPLQDAQRALKALKPRGAVVFHDCVGQPVWDGVQFLIDGGFRFHVYSTPQMLTVCWRGDVEMPFHVPDPAIDWTPARAQMPFDWSEES